MQTKKLWDYDNWDNFGEVDVFHHTPIYDSWQQFVDDDYALSCNCISGNPLLYWYWDNGYGYDIGSDDDSYDGFDFKSLVNRKEHFKRIFLIFKQWQVEMGCIQINVTAEDEPEIRKFIFKQQKNQTVFLG